MTDNLTLTTFKPAFGRYYPYIGVATDHEGQAVHVIFEAPGFGIQLGTPAKGRERAVYWHESLFTQLHGELRLFQTVERDEIRLEVQT